MACNGEFSSCSSEFRFSPTLAIRETLSYDTARVTVSLQGRVGRREPEWTFVGAETVAKVVTTSAILFSSHAPARDLTGVRARP